MRAVSTVTRGVVLFSMLTQALVLWPACIEGRWSGEDPLKVARSWLDRSAPPIWSSSGEQLVVSTFDGLMHVIEADGSGTTALPPGGERPFEYAGDISPDGTVVFIKIRHKGGLINSEDPVFDIGTVRTDGSDRRRIVDGARYAEPPRWSPDGSKIAFIGRFSDRQGLYVAATDSPTRHEVVRQRVINEFGHTEQFYGSPQWSPDGRKLAFIMSDGQGKMFLHTVNDDGTGLTRLVESESEPAWSPDGNRIAFVHQPSKEGDSTLYTVRSDGSDMRVVASWPETIIRCRGSVPLGKVSWSPDGLEIRRGGNPLLRVDSNGSNLRTMVISGEEGEADQLVACFSWSPDDSRLAAYFPRDRVVGTRVFVMEPDGSDVRVLYGKNVAPEFGWVEVNP